MSTPQSDPRDLLALHLVPGLGPRLTAALLQRFGTARAALAASTAELRQVPHIGDKLAQDFHAAMRDVDVGKELTLIERHGVQTLILGTEAYPRSLATIYDPPHVLYVRGNLEARDAKAIAVVGSRHCTSYGRRTAERLAGGLAHAGYTVISGLARGIDGMAHRGALQSSGRTIAVLAGGLSKIYPPEHADLATEIEQTGALLSEAPMEVDPIAWMFPARNRIISGLSRGVVVVEASERSGALITAEHAAEQGRPVFAVPGPVDSPASAGTLRLLRTGAVLVRGVDDILEELEGVKSAGSPPAPKTPPPELTEVQKQVWDFLAEQPRHLDEMAQQLHRGVPELASALLPMEMKKLVRRLPGNRYERT